MFSGHRSAWKGVVQDQCISFEALQVSRAQAGLFYTVLAYIAQRRSRVGNISSQDSRASLGVPATILARWIVENLCDALMLPQPTPVGSNDQYIFRDHRGMQWSTQALNSVLQNVLVESGDGTQLGVIGAIEDESEFCEGTPRI